MKSIGPLYGGKLKYWHKKALPVFEIGTTQETEMPYRLGKCLVVRVPFTHPGYYFGVFYHSPKINHDDDGKIDEILQRTMRGRTAWTPKDGAYEDFFKD